MSVFGVMWVGDHLIGDVFRLAQEFLQANDGCQDEGQFTEEQGFTDQEGESFEGQSFEHTEFHDSGGNEGAHVLVLASA